MTMMDDMGYTGTIKVAVTDAFSQTNELGTPQPSGTIKFPANALKDAVYGDNSNPTGVVTFSFLNPAKTYNFEIFGSRKDVTDNRETQYTASGSNTASTTLNPSSNASITTTINDILPDTNGIITLTVNKGTNNANSSGFYYLNALKISEKTPVQPDVLMNCEDGTTNRLAVLNVFSNGPGQSNADMVVVDNPNPSGINTSSKVVKFTRRTSGADAASWAGFYSHVVDPDPDFTENKYIHVKVLKQNPTGVRFKIENGAAGTVEKLSVNTYSQIGQWEDIVIDFSEKTGVYATLGLQPDYESPLVAGADRIIYFDDIILNNDPNPMVLGLDNQYLKNGISIYPNPVENILNIQSNSKIESVSIFTLDGRKVYDKNHYQSTDISVNLSNLKHGFYIVTITDETKKTISKKIIKN
jgi:hypothetical protein